MHSTPSPFACTFEEREQSCQEVFWISENTETLNNTVDSRSLSVKGSKKIHISQLSSVLQVQMWDKEMVQHLRALMALVRT